MPGIRMVATSSLAVMDIEPNSLQRIQTCFV